MSDATLGGDAQPKPEPTKKISPVRHVVGLVVLILVVVAGYLEISAKTGFNRAVAKLDERHPGEDSVADMLTESEVEQIVGRKADGPGVTEGFQTIKTYTWHGLRPHTITAFYTKQSEPRLKGYTTEGQSPPKAGEEPLPTDQADSVAPGPPGASSPPAEPRSEPPKVDASAEPAKAEPTPTAESTDAPPPSKGA